MISSFFTRPAARTAQHQFSIQSEERNMSATATCSASKGRVKHTTPCRPPGAHQAPRSRPRHGCTSHSQCGRSSPRTHRTQAPCPRRPLCAKATTHLVDRVTLAAWRRACLRARTRHHRCLLSANNACHALITVSVVMQHYSQPVFTTMRTLCMQKSQLSPGQQKLPKATRGVAHYCATHTHTHTHTCAHTSCARTSHVMVCVRNGTCVSVCVTACVLAQW